MPAMNRIQLTITALWGLGMLAMLGAWPSPGHEPAAGPVKISIANSIGKQEWLHLAVREFNAASPRDRALQLEGRPILVEILQETVDGRKQDYRSGTMITDALSGRVKPTILSPADEASIRRFQREWQAVHGRSIALNADDVIGRSPLVVAAWESRARSLGCWPTPEPGCTWERIRQLAAAPDGWGSVGRAEWGRLKLGYGYAGEEAPGTAGAVLMCMIGAGKPAGLAIADVQANAGCGEFMAAMDTAKIRAGTSSKWQLDEMFKLGPDYLDAVIIFEVDVVTANLAYGQRGPEPIVSIYPQDGTVLLGHPFAILDGVPWVTPDQVAAARVLQAFLQSPEQQRAMLTIGLRPVHPGVPPAPPLGPAYGANPDATLVTLELPDSQVIDRVVDVWHRVKKHAVIAIVFAKSSSMASTKIEGASAAAVELVRIAGRDDRLIWRPFDGVSYPPFESAGGPAGEELMAHIRATPAGGGSALYDAIRAAHDDLTRVRAARGDALRYGIVVLSDGRDTDSRTTLAGLEAQLGAREPDPSGIQIHTVAIGSDADEDGLWKIANAAGGRFWKSHTSADMEAIYRAIARYY
jgi:Ca-activated chloride channel family protein